jgi:uncharacterized protein
MSSACAVCTKAKLARTIKAQLPLLPSVYPSFELNLSMSPVLPARSNVPKQASTVVRVLLAALVVIVLGGLAITLVQLTDTALSIQERLARLPVWAAYPLAGALMGLGLALTYLVWRLLRPVKVAKTLNQAVTRDAVLARMQVLEASQQSVPMLASAHAEITELDRRAGASELYIALFGEISTGKSSLISALSGQPIAVHTTGGTTTSATLYRAELGPYSPVLMLSDVPGTNEVQAQAHAVLAREEALRAHVVALVVTGDLSRVQAAEWQWLVAFGKPVWLILNKIDRYSGAELPMLLARLKEKFGTDAIAVSAGFEQAITVIDAQGIERAGTRTRPANVHALTQKLRQFAQLHDRPATRNALEPARSKAVLNALDLKLSGVENRQRLIEGERLVQQYTRRAMVGAMASLAPGSDLVIQGALAFGLVKALSELYGIGMTKVDIDDLLSLLGGKLKGSVTLLLAIAGNAAKAFPGLGTLGGGALHALAYGLLFQSVGKALLECLDRQLLDARGGLDRLALLQHLNGELGNHRQLILRATQLARDFAKSP